MRPQDTRAAGDQNSPSWRPRGSLPGTGCADEASYVHARCPDRDLVLGVDTRQCRADTAHGPLVHRLGQVDQPAPALRVFQRGHPAQPPDLRLQGVDRPVRPAHRHRAAGQAPQRNRPARVTQGLEKSQGPDDVGAHRSGGRFVRRCRHCQHSGEVGVVGEYSGELLPADGVGEREVDDVGAVCSEPVGEGVRHVVLRRDHQPGALQLGARDCGDGLPGGAVAPGVDGGEVAALTAP